MNIFETKNVEKVDKTTTLVCESANDYAEFRKNDPRLPNIIPDKSNSVVNLTPVNRGHHY